MFKRSLTGLALVIGLGTASWSHALSLGELRLNSALNQPFQAEIPLSDASSLSSEQISVKLASVEDFEKAGVDYNYQLGNLNFSVSVAGDGKGVILVKSREPIVEPYLNFLVEARWPAGRMLREYTVLLDLPVVSDAKTSRVSAAQGGAAAQAANNEPAQREEVVVLEETLESAGSAKGPKPRADGERTSLPQAAAPTEYRVQHNDMLWNIASQFKPEGATVQQTMLALLRKNPRAFMGDNINRLKSGYVLRLPTADEAMRIDQDAALKEIRRQNAVWRGEALPSDGDLLESPQLDATQSAEPEQAVESKKSSARLSIATPGQSDSEGAGGAESGDVRQLRDQLAAAQEDTDRVARENAELNSRLGDLERQLATLQRLLELKDDQLATLQGQMGSEQQPGQTAPKQPNPATPEPAVDDSSLLDSPALRYGLIGLALLILAILALRKFSQSKTEAAYETGRFNDEDEADFDSEPAFTTTADDFDDDEDDDPGHTTVIIEPRKKNEAAAQADDDENFADLDELLADDQDEDHEAAATETTKTSAPIEAETDDALAEAEIYVAYGRYEQAAQMLSGAIAKEPSRSDLRVKLLAVYLETRDQANFMREFEALEALGDDEAVAEVKESMSAIEGVSDWLRSGSAGDTLIMDDNVDEPVADEEATDDSLGDLDFSLDDDDGAASDLDFDFELDEKAQADQPEIASTAETQLRSDSDLESATAAPDSDSADDLSLDDLAGELGAELSDNAEADADDAEISFEGLEDDDLDLTSFSLDDEADSDSADDKAQAEGKSEEGFELDLDDDFNLDDLETAPGITEVDDSASDDLGELSLDDLELDDLKLDDLSSSDAGADSVTVASEEPGALTEASAPAAEKDELDDLSLDDALLTTADDDVASLASDSEDFDELDSDDMSDDLGLLGDSDEVATKLDLARAYIDMGDAEGAKEMLQEVLEDGTDEQKSDANELLARL